MAVAAELIRLVEVRDVYAGAPSAVAATVAPDLESVGGGYCRGQGRGFLLPHKFHRATAFTDLPTPCAWGASARREGDTRARAVRGRGVNASNSNFNYDFRIRALGIWWRPGPPPNAESTKVSRLAKTAKVEDRQVPLMIRIDKMQLHGAPGVSESNKQRTTM